MKYRVFYIILLIGIIGLNYSCQKQSQEEIDQELIQEYISSHNLNVTKHPTGLWYEIKKKGGSVHPNINSKINVDYVKHWSFTKDVEYIMHTAFGDRYR